MIGTVERLISQGIIKDEKCKVCNQDTSLIVDVYLKILAIKLFVFPLQKRTVVGCTQCKKGDLKPFEMTSTAKKINFLKLTKKLKFQNVIFQDIYFLLFLFF